jgi:hypothetical protein
MRQGKGDPAIAALAIAIAVVLLCVASSAVLAIDGAKAEEELPTQLLNGFAATHAAGSAATFEPVLYATSAVFALGFLRVGPASLDLAVVHLPSSFPVWRATPARLGDWSRPATLAFDDGTLVLAGPDGAVLWRTLNTVGDTVALLNSSNLVVQRYENPQPAWQSFDHPADTLVVDQNFTASSSPLVSANRRFTLQLGRTYMAMHMQFDAGQAQAATAPVYWKHTALEAHLENATAPPVYGRLDALGFFGLYLDGGGGQRVDVLSFDTFALNLTGVFRRMTLDDDGNLRAYYWTTGDSSAWTSDYKAIAERCELPTSCGAYGVCVPGNAQCQCLDSNGTSTAPPCHGEDTADLCSTASSNGARQLGFDVVRRTRVSVAYKEELPFRTNTTADGCELACAGNCTCRGALYNGASGYCYLIDFPVETLVYQADDRMLGYFKIRKAATANSARRGMSPGVTAATVALSLVLAGLAAAGAYWGYRMWERRKRKRAGMEQELVPGPYRDLKSMASSNNSFKA